MKIGITGASGLIGQKLTKALEKKTHVVIPFVRDRNRSGIYWNAKRQEIDREALESLDGIVHLAGENIADRRWNDEKKRRILESRSLGTQFLTQEVLKLKRKPRFFISASAIGFYGDRGSKELVEADPPGKGFLAEVCTAWENAALPLRDETRLCWARIGIVLSKEGGALAKMITPFRYGLGGKLGSGSQYMSWIDIEDLIEAFLFLIENEQATGAFNLTAPNPVTNHEFTSQLSQELARPAFFSVPSFALRALAGEMADALLLASTKALPKQLKSMGFRFRHENLESSLKNQLF